MYDQTNRKSGLERITEKEMEEKVRKQGYTMTFPTKEEVNFALRLENFDLPNNGKESRYASLSFCRGSRVEGSMSRVEGTMSRVEVNIFFQFFFLEKVIIDAINVIKRNKKNLKNKWRVNIF